MLGNGVPGNSHGAYLVAADHTNMLLSVLPNLVWGIKKCTSLVCVKLTHVTAYLFLIEYKIV